MDERTSLLCRIWGHDLDPDASYYYCVDYCRKCERQVDGSTGLRERFKVLWWIFVSNVRHTLFGWRCWLKCDECGKYFGRHDDRFDHIPF